jgi:3-hydroxyacyl-CoA dehydrogenase
VIPCGGGVKEALFRFGSAQAAFDAIVFNQNSTSAHEARKRGWLRPTDVIVANADQLLPTAYRLAQSSLQPWSGPDREPGEVTVPEALTGHDRVIAQAVAWVLTGPHSERALLVRERTAFLQLAQEPLSIARMRHLLGTGKPLKN